MTEVLELDDLRAVVAGATTVAAVGACTHWEVGGPPPAGEDVTYVRAPAGIVSYDPADLTVTVRAGTSVGELGAALASAAQEVVLDPRDPAATIGGLLATGLSGHRRLRHGPLRDRVLEVRFVTAEGRLVKGGGPTVKNVSGYDLPRLLVGSFGTIGVLVQVTLRCQPRAPLSAWWVTDADPFAVRRALYRPSCLAWDGVRTWVLLEGVAADVDAERARLAGESDASEAPSWPQGAHRGRISVQPSVLGELAPELDAAGVRWMAEVGVGTVHVASDDETGLVQARAAAAAAGGWMMREAGAPDLDGFGTPPPNAALAARVRAAFDPGGKCAPGRLPPEARDA